MIEFIDIGIVVEVWQKIVGTTEDATVAFQQRYSLEVDDVAGPESWGVGLKTLE